MEMTNESSSKRSPKSPQLAPSQIKTLSLSRYLKGTPTEQAEFAEAFFLGLKEIGFVILKDHGIEPALLRKCYERSEMLFKLSEEQKLAYVSPRGGGDRGYTAFGLEHAKDNPHPDLKEFWHVGRELPPTHPKFASYPQNIWPSEVSGFRSDFLELYKKLDEAGRLMLESLTGPLKVEKDYFDNMTDYGSSVLRLLHYPPIPEGADQNSIRAAAHEDINLITLLVSASASGLELLDRDGNWITVESEPNDLIVDSGDMLSRITNQVIPSTTHRVVNPSGPNVSRYSMPFFMHPNPDALLQCIDSCKGTAGPLFPDILAQDFLDQRLQEIGLKS